MLQTLLLGGLLFYTAAFTAQDFSVVAPANPIPNTTLRFQVTNLRAAQGTVWVGIYTSDDDFLDREKARLVYVRVTQTGSMEIDVPDLVPGKEYALGIFQDLDDNGEFDTNWLGLPAEPWAFSGTLKSRFRLPRFEEVKFTFSPEEERPSLRLRTLF